MNPVLKEHMGKRDLKLKRKSGIGEHRPVAHTLDRGRIQQHHRSEDLCYPPGYIQQLFRGTF